MRNHLLMSPGSCHTLEDSEFSNESRMIGLFGMCYGSSVEVMILS